MQFGFDAANSGVQYGANKKAAGDSWDRYKNSLTRGPGYMRQGLEAAGFNPLLAVGNPGLLGGKSSPQQGVSRGNTDSVRAGKLKPETELLKQQTATSAATQDREGATSRLLASQETKARLEADAIYATLPRMHAEADFARSDLGRNLIIGATANRYATDASPSIKSVFGGGLTSAATYGPDLMKRFSKAIGRQSEKSQQERSKQNYKSKTEQQLQQNWRHQLKTGGKK